MATGVEDCIELVGRNLREWYGVGERRLGLLVFLEAAHGVGLRSRIIALGIEWRLSSFGRGQRNVHPGVLEDVVRSGELLQPESGLPARVAEPIVRSENHQNSAHLVPPLLVRCRRPCRASCGEL